ncbi:diaminopimelate epimerase [Flavobacteriaceae bacterium F08102]|nr:diaminopimelate epimerase [Flavobacteriaceae bacterium F08102]
MQIHFSKYQGTGNDFIMIDNRNGKFPKENKSLIAKLCDRKFGIGADGLICLDTSDKHDFTMVYFNADGAEGSMCGNGGRCIVAFARDLNIIKTNTTFDAMDGLHHASIINDIVSLKMVDVREVEHHADHLFLNTGSPHHVTFVENLKNYEVVQKGREIRYGAPYFETGSNVNFVEQVNENTFNVRTYERGVEDETLSCGTGVTAVAIAAHASRKTKDFTINLNTLGGELIVSFSSDNKSYSAVSLTGKALFVFDGQIDI